MLTLGPKLSKNTSTEAAPTDRVPLSATTEIVFNPEDSCTEPENVPLALENVAFTTLFRTTCVTS